MKRISILGSTGSIGRQTLDVVREHGDLFSVRALAAYNNVHVLKEQIEEFKPHIAVLYDSEAARELMSEYHGATKILSGKEGLLAIASYSEVDMVVTSLTGFAGLEPTLAAIEAGKDIALANKETLVAAGELVMQRAAEKNVAILPVDSEHGAIYQCLQGNDKKSVKKLILTASGGPLRGMKKEQLAAVTVDKCMNHPTWSMGKKITIDSASLVNKGLEVIEAHWLYDMPYEKIQTVVHPQSIVHSLVEYVDGSVIAQLGTPDMRLPIQYALNYPQRLPLSVPKLDFWQIPNLTFEKPDFETFRGIDLAYAAGRQGGTAPCALNAANEVAVAAFLAGKIGFLDIYKIIEAVLENHQSEAATSLEVLQECDFKARALAQQVAADI